MAPVYELKSTLVRIDNVCLSFEGRPILAGINAVVRDIVRPGCSQGQVVGILGPSGVGKCLARGTPVLMFDGSTKRVETVVVGDRLMGPDSKPRLVLGLGQGFDQMYKIVPVKGDPFTVNAGHILPLKLCRSKRSKARHEELTVTEYIGKSRTFKNRAKMYRSGLIDFPEKPVFVEPYFFGLWLGDGDQDNPTITNIDDEIVGEIHNYALAAGAEVSRYQYGQRCPRYRVVNRKGSGRSSGEIIGSLRSTGATDNKHIPLVYKANSREVRMQLLAGLLDSDGSLIHKCFDYSSKIRTLAEDVCYVARSLGFAAYMSPAIKKCQTGGGGIYYRVCISGDTDTLPVRVRRKKSGTRKQIKNVLHTGFTVQDAGKGEYFGFQLDGDGLFLLSDFTVTHNTQLSRILAGLMEPTSGSIYIESNGEPVQPGIVGLVAQNYPLLPHRTVMGNLVVAARQKGLSTKEAKEQSAAMLARFELSDRAEAWPAELSGGQRQRVAIAQQLLCSDHYLVLDEPFTGLDPVMKDRASDLIRQVSMLHEENTIFVVAHDLAAVASVADTLWLLGRTRAATGGSLGSTIVQTYDLIERGIAWNPEAQHTRVFDDLLHEIRARFDTL